MKYITIVYTSFLLLIGVVCYITQSGWPLLLVICLPEFEYRQTNDKNAKSKKKKKKNKNQ